MPKIKTHRLGDLQLQIMKVLWRRDDPVTVGEVHQAVSGPTPLAYTTIATKAGSGSRGRGQQGVGVSPHYLHFCALVLLIQNQLQKSALAILSHTAPSATNQELTKATHPCHL